MACREPRYAVCWDSIAEAVPECAATVGVFAREIEEVNAREDDEEAAEKGDRVDGVGGVEPAEEKEGRHKGTGSECYVV